MFFRKIFKRIPSHPSELAFCRAYLLFKKWKNLQPTTSNDNIEMEMEICLYKPYKISPKNIKKNSVIHKIIFSKSTTPSDILTFEQNETEILMKRYFHFFSTEVIHGEVISEALQIDVPKQDTQVNTLCYS